MVTKVVPKPDIRSDHMVLFTFFCGFFASCPFLLLIASVVLRNANYLQKLGKIWQDMARMIFNFQRCTTYSTAYGSTDYGVCSMYYVPVERSGIMLDVSNSKVSALLSGTRHLTTT